MRSTLSIGLLWAGYAVAFWGFCLIKGYNVSFVQIINPANITAAGKTTPLSSSGAPLVINAWPPQLASPTVVIPNGSITDVGSGANYG